MFKVLHGLLPAPGDKASQDDVQYGRYVIV